MPIKRKDLAELIQKAQPPQTRSKRIDVRLTEAEEQLFKAAAEKSDLSVSEWLRSLGRAAAKAEFIEILERRRRNAPLRNEE